MDQQEIKTRLEEIKMLRDLVEKMKKNFDEELASIKNELEKAKQEEIDKRNKGFCNERFW